MDINSLNIHACLGESCYCHPGNEHLWIWSDEMRKKLMDTFKEIMRLEDESKC